MSFQTIDQLNAASTVNASDVLEVSQSGTSAKMTITQINSLEATARASADSTLTSAIATETSNRSSAITTVTTLANGSIQPTGTVTYTANQPMGGYKHTGMGAGSATGDSVNWDQVLLAAGGNGYTAILAAGTNAFTAAQSMGGYKLTNLGTPTASTDASTKAYVDALTLSTLPSPTSAVGFNSQLASNLANPVSNQDAVTKLYLTEQANWDSRVGYGLISTISGSSLTLTPGTSQSTQVFNSYSASSSKTINVATSTTYDQHFTIYQAGLNVSTGYTLTYQYPGPVYQPGLHLTQAIEYKQDATNGTSVYISPKYLPHNSYGPDMYLRWYSYLYDFSSIGGATGTITLSGAPIPSGVIIGSQQAIIETLTVFTSGGSATVSWGINVAGGSNYNTAFDTATAISATPYNAAAGVLKLGTIGNTLNLVGVANVTITIGTANLTAGKAWIHIPVLVNR